MVLSREAPKSRWMGRCASEEHRGITCDGRGSRCRRGPRQVHPLVGRHPANPKRLPFGGTLLRIGDLAPDQHLCLAESSRNDEDKAEGQDDEFSRREANVSNGPQPDELLLRSPPGLPLVG